LADGIRHVLLSVTCAGQTLCRATKLNGDGKDRIAGRGYRPEDIDIVGQSGVASGFTAVVVLALYINSSAVQQLYTYPWLIWPLVPIVLYIIIRVWILAHRKEMDDDPVVFLANDWRSQVVIAIGAVLLFVAGMR
jgi:4-hydroxybenzoate polyprenyltransferase